MQVKINYTKQCHKFFKKNQSVVKEEEVSSLLLKAVKYLLKQEDMNVDVKQLVGYDLPHYRLRVGKIRVIFVIINGVVTVVQVKKMGFRGDVYK